jgi:hypothetical protein
MVAVFLCKDDEHPCAVLMRGYKNYAPAEGSADKKSPIQLWLCMSEELFYRIRSKDISSERV